MKKFDVTYKTGRGYTVSIDGVVADSKAQAVARAWEMAERINGGPVKSGRAVERKAETVK